MTMSAELCALAQIDIARASDSVLHRAHGGDVQARGTVARTPEIRKSIGLNIFAWRMDCRTRSPTSGFPSEILGLANVFRWIPQDKLQRSEAEVGRPQVLGQKCSRVESHDRGFARSGLASSMIGGSRPDMHLDPSAEGLPGCAGSAGDRGGAESASSEIYSARRVPSIVGIGHLPPARGGTCSTARSSKLVGRPTSYWRSKFSRAEAEIFAPQRLPCGDLVRGNEEIY